MYVLYLYLSNTTERTNSRATIKWIQQQTARVQYVFVSVCLKSECVCRCRCACAECRCPRCVCEFLWVGVWVRCLITRYAIWKILRVAFWHFEYDSIRIGFNVDIDCAFVCIRWKFTLWDFSTQDSTHDIQQKMWCTRYTYVWYIHIYFLRRKYLCAAFKNSDSCCCECGADYLMDR